jgi:hypothetical protein
MKFDPRASTVSAAEYAVELGLVYARPIKLCVPATYGMVPVSLDAVEPENPIYPCRTPAALVNSKYPVFAALPGIADTYPVDEFPPTRIDPVSPATI